MFTSHARPGCTVEVYNGSSDICTIDGNAAAAVTFSAKSG